MRSVGLSYGITDRKSHAPVGTNKFVAIDGEGINLADGRQPYALLGIGKKQIENPDGLHWSEILPALYDVHKHNGPHVAYVGFYLGYDFDKWLCTMPKAKVERLITSEGRESRKSTSANLHGRVLPVDFPGGWQVNMLGKKMFEFRHRECHCDILYCKCPGKGPWMRICDAGPFFQSSFLKAIDPATWQTPIVTNDEYELVVKGKANRAFADHVTDEMRYYNQLENDILVRLMNVLNDGFKEMGITLAPGQWFGPGQAAQKWLKGEKVTTAEELRETLCIENVIPPLTNDLLSSNQMAEVFANIRTKDNPSLIANTVRSGGATVSVSLVRKQEPLTKSSSGETESLFFGAARQSYFGGWFEIMMHGMIPGESHEYDINSAYPYIISSLPCLLHGEYKRGSDKVPPNGQYVLVRASVSSYRNGLPSVIGTMLHRDRSDRILRPTRTKGWYWYHEIEAAKRAKLILRCHIYEWISYDPCDCLPPMRNVSNLYDLRNKVGKDTPLGKGCKLAYNSMYGKFAQSIGNPVFANPVWASLITAGCRTMILNAIATHPKGKWDVSMVATDAVFFCTPHPELPISKKLGEWDHTIRSNLTLFKPGVYWDDKTRDAIAENGKPVFKARGISGADFASSIAKVDGIFAGWDTDNPDLSVVRGMVAGWPFIEFKTGFSMVSCLQAIRRGKWELAGYVSQSGTMVQNANPYDKRIGAWKYTLEDGRTVWRSEPWTIPLDNCESKPYQKRFGMEDPWSLERIEIYGITPDGTIPDLINEGLYE